MRPDAQAVAKSRTVRSPIRRSSAFVSILFDEPVDAERIDQQREPGFFTDLNLDQVVDAITWDRAGYNLRPFFYVRLNTAKSISYRHEIGRDLESDRVVGIVESFAEKMREMRATLTQADKLHYKYPKGCYVLDAVDSYCDAVSTLARDLGVADIRSEGLTSFRDYLLAYSESREFRALLAESTELKRALAEVTYCVHIRGPHVRVTRYDGELDYSSDVLQTFEKFAHGAAQDYRVKYGNWAEMGDVEARVLECVALLYPKTFSSLEDYVQRHRVYLDPVIQRFDREIQFFIGYLKFARQLGADGRLPFCYPEVSDISQEIYARETFDIALAAGLASEGAEVVRNDFDLKGPERIFVVTGPNQSGKTTFARTFGQLHYLAGLGLPVPGREVRTYLCDQLFTHFEKEEDLEDLRGKLEDDLLRIHEILQKATPRSVVILNEIFTSTTIADALFLGTKTIEQLIELGAFCAYVTFVDELSRIGDATVSMVTSVDPDNPAIRTFKVERRPADGRAYAITLAEKHGLTRERLRRRLPS